MRPSSCSTHSILALVPIFGALLLGSAAVDAADQSKTWWIGLCHVGLDHEPPIPPAILLRADEVIE